MKKIVQPRYRFFNDLYRSIDVIPKESLEDAYPKEIPTKRYCVIDEDDRDKELISTEQPGVEVYQTPEAAKKAAEEF
ncbi:hypothetical protein [Priestia aryabhattai]